MEHKNLGHTDIKVSIICLGTMTYGEQNTETEAHEQLDYAVGQGVNFIDTAEMYAVPTRKETFGETERMIGTWLAKRGKRDDLVIATKVIGAGRGFAYIRDGNSHLDRKNITEALNNSLRRLQTDYVDLYQLHWPDRNTNLFGKLGYEFDPDDNAVPIEETLAVLADCVREGKIRHVGVSNETPWGVGRYLHAAESRDLPRIVSIQNPYNLLNRVYEIGLAEFAQREQVGLLAYSPLAFATLSGKYLGGAQPEGARLTLFKQFQRYLTERGVSATERYVALARDHGISPAQMALAYINSRPFVTANIIGATTMEQLRENLSSAELTLTNDIIEEIENIHSLDPNPCP